VVKWINGASISAISLGNGDNAGDNIKVLESSVMMFTGAAEVGPHLVGDAWPAVLPRDPVGLSNAHCHTWC
jgi:hypothetical protein